MTFVPHPLLCCPLDGSPLTQQGPSLSCANGHSFDIARQGYVNLLGPADKRSRDPGDSKAMVVARQQFLEAGHYQPLATRFADLVLDRLADGEVLVDAGCGEAYYLEQLQLRGQARGRAGPDVIGFDISKWALQAAARRFDACWLVASNRQIPLATGASMVTSLFGFPDYRSFRQLLLPGACLLEIDAGPEHLIELRQLIYREVKSPKPYSWDRAQAAGFALAATEQVQFVTAQMGQSDIACLLQMTPHMFRASAEGRQRVAQLQSLAVTVDVRINLLINPEQAVG
jgi:23S rRNA (guanine745-N1)-methyltransferase